jgi:hypothetical protein
MRKESARDLQNVTAKSLARSFFSGGRNLACNNFLALRVFNEHTA